MVMMLTITIVMLLLHNLESTDTCTTHYDGTKTFFYCWNGLPLGPLPPQLRPCGHKVTTREGADVVTIVQRQQKTWSSVLILFHVPKPNQGPDLPC
jgi:hypothetical protein